jgi:hypothetical protein
LLLNRIKRKQECTRHARPLRILTTWWLCFAFIGLLSFAPPCAMFSGWAVVVGVFYDRRTRKKKAQTHRQPSLLSFAATATPAHVSPPRSIVRACLVCPVVAKILAFACSMATIANDPEPQPEPDGSAHPPPPHPHPPPPNPAAPDRMSPVQPRRDDLWRHAMRWALIGGSLGAVAVFVHIVGRTAPFFRVTDPRQLPPQSVCSRWGCLLFFF